MGKKYVHQNLDICPADMASNLLRICSICSCSLSILSCFSVASAACFMFTTICFADDIISGSISKMLKSMVSVIHSQRIYVFLKNCSIHLSTCPQTGFDHLPHHSYYQRGIPNAHLSKEVLDKSGELDGFRNDHSCHVTPLQRGRLF